MRFFRPSLNEHGLTEQQWRIVRGLRQYGALEIHKLADLSCIVGPSMTGVLSRMEKAGLITRQKVQHDHRIVLVDLTETGHVCFESMSECMEQNYLHLQRQLGAEKLEALLVLLSELKAVKHWI